MLLNLPYRKIRLWLILMQFSALTIPFTNCALAQVLDVLPPSSAAYSIRKLSSTYTLNSPAYPTVAGCSYVPLPITNPAIRVRRNSDDAQQDIGFDAAGNLNEQALIDFIGGPNWFRHSEQFNSAGSWSSVGLSVTADAAIAPNGALTADLITETAGNNEHFIDYNLTGPAASQSYAMRVYVQPINHSNRRFILRGVFADGSSSSFISFDLNAGTIIGITGGLWSNTSITPLPAGWYCLQGVYTTGASIPAGLDLVFRLQYMETTPLANVYNGNTAISSAVWGAQLQPGNTFLGYTPTNLLPQWVIPNGYIHTWFDQSGNNRHLSQVSQDNQPLLVNAGIVLRTANGRPTARFFGEFGYNKSSFLLNASASTTLTNSSLNMVSRWKSTRGTGNLDIPFGAGTVNDTRRGRFFYRNVTTALGWSAWSADVNNTAVQVDTNGTHHTFNAFQSATALILSRDGVEYPYTIPQVPLTPSTAIFMGQPNNPGQIADYFSDIEFSEAMIFASSLALADRRTLQCDQGTYYTLPTTIAGLNFFISSVVDTTACSMNMEEVAWNTTTLANVTLNGTNQQKTTTFSWDGGGASLNSVGANGYFEFRAVETNKARMAGLSTTFGSVNYTNIQFAVYLRNDAIIQIYESGNLRGTFGNYQTNDVFRVGVESGSIRYYRNGVLFYSSAVTPVLPLLVHTSLYDVGATVVDPKIWNYCNGVYQANASNTGPNPVYQWKVNGLNVGTNSNTYTNPALAVNDVVTCQLTLNGCASNAITSNAITKKTVSPNPSLQFYIEAVSDTDGCYAATEPMVWRYLSLDNLLKVQTTATSITKVSGSGWDAAGASRNRVYNNGSFRFIAGQSNRALMGGLSTTYTVPSYTGIQFAIYLTNSGAIQIYESGAYIGAYGNYAAGDTFSVNIENNRIYYYRNSTLFYASATVPVLPMIANVSIADIGGNINNLAILNRHAGQFSATVLNGTPNPNYNWQINGVSVQSGPSSVFQPSVLNNSDLVSCQLQLTGCLSNTYASTTIRVNGASASPATRIWIRGIPDTIGCLKTGEEVVWKFTSLSNEQVLTVNGSQLIKKVLNGWNGGAASWNQVFNNGYLEFKATETNRNRIVGLSDIYSGNSSNNIQFGLYLQSGGILSIIETGVSRGNFGTYVTGDVLRVAVDNGAVRYYKNGMMFHTSTVVPVLPLIVTACLNEIGATLADLWVWNNGSGQLAANAVHPVNQYTFQWWRNNALAGISLPLYNNPATQPGDTVTCVLGVTPCITGTLSSNRVVIKNQEPNPSLSVFIRAQSDTSSCSYAGESVVWAFTSLSDAESLQITGGDVVKTNTSASWNASTLSRNLVYEGGFIEFIATETNKTRVIGLSDPYIASGLAHVEYGIYLQNNAALSIYEAGVNRGGYGTYVTGDTFRVAIEENRIRYYKNGVLFLTGGAPSIIPLRASTSFFDQGGTLIRPMVWNLNNGNFSAFILNGSLPVNYQWNNNGAPVGANSPALSLPGLNNTDTIRCNFQFAGCFNHNLTSNLIARRGRTPNPNLSFVIQGEVDLNACRLAGEDVVWRPFTNFGDWARLLKLTNNLTKVSGTGWDAGAASLNRVSNNGYLEFTASETNKARMLGLSSSYAGPGFGGIQFAFYLQGNGALGVYESGTNRGNYGVYATGDILRIAVQAGVVRYFRNGVLLYTSTVSPALPLLVQAAISDLGGTFTNVKVFNYNNGIFRADAKLAGVGLNYTWKLNGTTVQNGPADTYTNANLNLFDTITCVLSLGGCFQGTTYLSNKIVIIGAPQITPDFFIEGTPVLPGCFVAAEQVQWLLTDLSSNLSTVNTSGLVKSSGTAGWNAGAASWNQVRNNGYFEFKAIETNRLRAAGLSGSNNGSDLASINFAFCLQSNGQYKIFESGADRGVFGTYHTGSVFRIKVDGGIVEYLENDTIVYISAVLPPMPMLADVSINEIGGTISEAKVVNHNFGRFEASSVNAGTYQWMVNGIAVQIGLSSTYNNPGLNNGDTITCMLSTNLPGCQPQQLHSNHIVFIHKPTDSTEVAIQGVPAINTCDFVREQVKWKMTEFTNSNMVLRPDNSLIKLQSNAVWNGGASSWNRVFNNGYLEFSAEETNRHRFVGLTNGYTGNGYTSMQYGIFLQNAGTIRIYESGTDRGLFGSYATGDIFRISVENNIVRYFKNGTLLYASLVAPTLPLNVDVSIYDRLGTVTGVFTGNYFNQTLAASTSQAAAGSSYEWSVNGVVQQNSASPTFTPVNPQNGDTIRCRLFSAPSGCTVFPFASNYVVWGTAPPPGADLAITTTAASASCAMVTEPVRWKLSDLTRDAVPLNGNGLIRLQSSGWNCGGFSWNKVNNNGYMEFTVGETNKARMIGLSATNPNADWTSIQFAIYLTSAGTFDVRQSGNTIAIPGGTYATNDVFRIAVDNAVVKYFKNGILIYTSLLAPSLPLSVDCSINETGGTVRNVIITNFSSGVFQANAPGTGTNPVYDWRVNGLSVQNGTSPSYTNFNLQNGDQLECILTCAQTGCNDTLLRSNIITTTIIGQVNIDFGITGQAVPTSCAKVTESVQWKKSDLSATVNTVNGNGLVKVGNNSLWDGGAASWNRVNAEGYFQFNALENNKTRMIGLSTSNTSSDQNTIRYAFLLENSATYRIYELGVYKGVFGTYATGDTFRISVSSGVVRYMVNSTAVYNSALVPTLPLIADVSLYETGSTVHQALVVNFNAGTFEALTLNPGSGPDYEWFLNGVSVQSGTSSLYTNTNLNTGDVITCTMTPNLAGCSNNQPLPSNQVSNQIVVPDNVDAWMRGVPATGTCNVLYENVKWKATDLTNVAANANSLVKTQSDGVWDGGASSWNQVGLNGGFQFIVTETNKARVAGLSLNNTSSNNTSVGFAFHLLATGELRIIESGVDRAITNSYIPGDVLRISIELVAGQNRARYYKNSQLVYASIVNIPVLPLVADVSIFNQGGTITQAIVYNPNNGSFIAGATNAGAANYEWKLNGNTVQNGLQNTYTNPALNHNDSLRCIITPGLTGCANIDFPSNVCAFKGPVLQINNPPPVCSPNTADITLPAVTAGTPPDLVLSYWTNAAGTTALTNPRNVGAGTYYIRGTRFGTCTDIEPVTVTVVAPPTGAVTSANSQLDCNNLSVQLNAAGNAPLTWDNGSTSATRSVSTPGTYLATFTNAQNCTTRVRHLVYENKQPPVISITGNTSPICQGASVNLNAIATTYNNALRLDGNSQSAELGSWFNFNNFTVEMWVRPDPLQAPFATLIDNNFAATGKSWTCSQNNVTNNQYQFTCYSSAGSATATFTLAPNVWQHLTLVKTPIALQVYMNGNLITSTPWNFGAVYYDGTQQLRIGNWGGGTRFWSGQMDELRIFDSDLSAAQIAADVNSIYPANSATLFAYYKMDQPDNSPTLLNITGNGTASGPLFGNPNFLPSGLAVPNTFTYLWTPGGATTTGVSLVPTGPVTYLTTVTGNNGCPKTDSTELSVSLNSVATVTAPVNACLGSGSTAVTFSATGAAPPYTFYYNLNGSPASAVSQPGLTTATVQLPNNSAGSFTYTLQNLTYQGASFCLQAQAGTTTVTVHPLPQVQINTPGAICAPDSIDLTAASIVAGSASGLSYSYWNNAAATQVLAAPNSIQQSGTYYIQGTSPLTGCSSTIAVNATVHPQPQMTTTFQDTVCNGSAVALTWSSTLPSSYSWTTGIPTGGAAGATAGNGNSLQQPLSIPGNNAVGTVSYIVTPIAATTGCVGISDTIDVPVASTPQITAFNNGLGCGAVSVALNALSSAGTVHWYDAASGGSLLASGNNFNTPVIAGTTTYYAIAEFAGCTSATPQAVVAEIEYPGQWLGFSTDWNTLTNWGCQLLPNATTDVSIPTVPKGGFFPVVSSNGTALCRDIDIAAGASVTITALSDLSLYGDLQNNGSGNLGSGNLRLNAGVPQNIFGLTAQRIGQLTVNNASNFNSIRLLTDIIINDRLEFIDGIIALNSFELSVGSNTQNALITNSGNGRHINTGTGHLREFINTAGLYLFPVGDSVDYTPASIDLHSGMQNGSSIKVRVTKGKQPNLLASTDYLNRYWSVEPDLMLSGIDYDIRYTYMDPAERIGVGMLYPVKHSFIAPVGWTSCPGSGYPFMNGSSGLFTPALKTFEWFNLSAFSDFTGAGLTQPLPVSLLFFEALANDNHVKTRWATASETNNDYFTVERSADAIDFQPVGIVDGSGQSNALIQYAFTDAEPLPGLSYYRLKQTDFDGSATYSEIKPVRFTEDPASPSLQFTHLNTNGMLTFAFSKGVAVERLSIFDSSGRMVYEENLAREILQQGSLQIPMLSNGIYLMVISTPESEFKSKISPVK